MDRWRTVSVTESAYPRLRLGALSLAIVVVATDQLTKLWAESVLPGREPIPLLGGLLRLRLLYNTGAAFSMASNSTWVVTIFTGVAVVALTWFVTRIRSLSGAIGIGLVLGGASTHLLDRLLRAPGFAVGHVVDFIDYGGLFVGNVADIALTVGVGMLILESFAEPRRSRQVGEMKRH